MLDEIVARTVAQARLLEKACHDQGEWEIAIGRAVSPAIRIMTADSIIIEAVFAPQCWVSTPYMTAELRLGGQTQSARPIAVPDDEVEFSICWRFEVKTPQVASIRT